MTLNRRQFLGAAAATGAAAGLLTPAMARAASVCAPAGATLDDIEHVVILMQENRSFDEYFGRMSGVIGFADPAALPGVFKQLGGSNQTAGISNGIQNGDPGQVANVAADPVLETDGYILPWRMDTKTTDAQSSGGLLHDWPNQHAMFNSGLMDGFLPAQSEEPVVMGYYEREDIPYHWALADAWTVCDRYHCSVFGPTNPNRIVFMSGTIDPTGTLGGGPCIENTQSNGVLQWESFPETLQKAGIDWYLYQENDNYSDNMLPFFTAFQDTTTDLYRRGNSFIPSTALLGEATAARIKSDVLAGKLPQVSYIVGAQETSEHPNATTGRGAQFIDQVLDALTSDLKVWSKTLLILNYDENDGHFDHVVPPVPPAGDTTDSVGGLPVGLGFRVPCILISPFTRGPLVSSDVFDHTSVIKLIERRFGVHCPNISDWRRATVGDLTSAINFAATPSVSLPALPNGDQQAADAKAQASLPTPNPPSPQVMPGQETTPVRGRPSGLVAPAATAAAACAPVTVLTVVPTVAPPFVPAKPGSPAQTTAAKVAAIKGATPAEQRKIIAGRRAAKKASKTVAVSQPAGALAFTGLDTTAAATGALLAAAGLAAARSRRRGDDADPDA